MEVLGDRVNVVMKNAGNGCGHLVTTSRPWKVCYLRWGKDEARRSLEEGEWMGIVLDWKAVGLSAFVTAC